MGVSLVLLGVMGMLAGLVNVVYPIRQMKITSRKMAAAVLGVGFAAFVMGGILLPPAELQKTPVQKGPTERLAAEPAPETPAAVPAPQERLSTPAPEPAPAPKPTPAPEQATAPEPAPAPQPAPAAPTDTVQVVSVTDGDTIKVRIGGRSETVRLIGVDTPETVHPSKPVEPYGPEASAYTKRRLAGQNVRLEFDVEERDRYGRLLGYVWLGNELFNATLVRDGYGQVLTIPPNVKYADQFVALQREARENNRGLWRLDAANREPAPGTSVYYKSCKAAREAGVTPLYRGQPGYGPHLDADGDGVACE